MLSVLGLLSLVLGATAFHAIGQGPLDDRPPRPLAYLRLAVFLTSITLLLFGFLVIVWQVMF